MRMFYLLFVGLFCIELDQPAVKPEETFTIACKITGYSASGGGCNTNWIRHSSGKPMEWIGYFYSSSNNRVTDSLKNKISFSSESSSNAVILTGKNFNTEDTAVYYCARYSQKSSQSLLYCQFCHMYRTYIQRIEIALTLNTNSRT